MQPMSQFTPPPPLTLPPEPGYTGHDPSRPRPMSSAAAGGFVCSLILCVPLLTQLLGGVLGIVGIARTSGGRQRGRGLAIAAVGISVVGLVLWIGAGLFGLWGWEIMHTGVPFEELLRDDSPANITQLRDECFSARLALAVDEQAWADYVQQVRDEYGTLQSATFDSKPVTTTPGGQGIIVHRRVLFTKETDESRASIDVTLGFRGLQAEIDNITVGDLTLLPEQ